MDTDSRHNSSLNGDGIFLDLRDQNMWLVLRILAVTMVFGIVATTELADIIMVPKHDLGEIPKSFSRKAYASSCLTIVIIIEGSMFLPLVKDSV